MFRHQRDQEGQAMVEFVLGLMIVISFFFFYVRMCAVFAVSNYIHYATFMASRAYMSGSKTSSEQLDRANQTLKAMVDKRFKSVVKGKGGDGTSITGATIGQGPYFQDDPLHDYWNQGVTYNFTSKLSLYPWSKENQSVMIELTSESWMPQDPSADQVLIQKKKIAQALASAGVTNAQVEWDNGD